MIHGSFALECMEVPLRILMVGISSCSQSAVAYQVYFVAIVTFDETSRGQLAMAIYEWQDVKYLGKETYGEDDLPVSVDLSRSVSTD
jgi:hypothetical protein